VDSQEPDFISFGLSFLGDVTGNEGLDRPFDFPIRDDFAPNLALSVGAFRDTDWSFGAIQPSDWFLA
jgi:hypothetical protein